MAETGSATLHERRTVRAIYFTLGIVSLAVGLVGIVLPLIPTTGPVLVSAFFFARSSERVHGWLIHHKRFGPAIHDYQNGLGIPMKGKLTAVAMIAVTFGITMLLTVTTWQGRVVLILTAAGILWFILSRPTKPVAAPVGPAVEV